MNDALPQKPATAAPADGEGSHDALPRYTSAQLFGDARELVIEHRGREYRLRITASGKLILTA